MELYDTRVMRDQTSQALHLTWGGLMLTVILGSGYVVENSDVFLFSTLFSGMILMSGLVALVGVYYEIAGEQTSS